MKKLRTILFMTAMTVMGHLLFDMYHSQSLAGPVQAGATVHLMSDLRNPVEGTLGLELGGLRAMATLGNDGRIGGTLDLIARTEGGLYVGAGVVGDKLSDIDYEVESTEQSTSTFSKHDSGKHRGDKHQRNGKTVTATTSRARIVTINTTDVGVSSSIIIGLAAKRGLFAETRVLFDAGEVSNRTTVGVSW